MGENVIEDSFYEDYYVDSSQISWRYSYRRLRRASELMYVFSFFSPICYIYEKLNRIRLENLGFILSMFRTCF